MTLDQARRAYRTLADAYNEMWYSAGCTYHGMSPEQEEWLENRAAALNAIRYQMFRIANSSPLVFALKDEP